jgi:hypothetical protein
MNVIRHSANRLRNAVEIAHYTTEIGMKPLTYWLGDGRHAVLCAKYNVIVQ